ncbi:MAG: hypothetical protein HC828_09670 [Blastochloris sp.]|nr:hypothetical protein [Blastochloris sp.]
MSSQPSAAPPIDPFAMWRSMRDATMDAWSKVMIEVVNTEAYAKATGTMLDTYLTTSAPFRKALETTMTQVLTQLNMPTRTDMTAIADRLTNIELRLDDIEARLDEQRVAIPAQEHLT